MKRKFLLSLIVVLCIVCAFSIFSANNFSSVKITYAAGDSGTEYEDLPDEYKLVIDAVKKFYEDAKAVKYEELTKNSDAERSYLINLQQKYDYLESDGVKTYITVIPFEYVDGGETKIITADEAYAFAKKHIEDCINKIDALKTVEDKKSHFESELALFPEIIDTTKEHKNKLEILKAELKDYIDVYVPHLEADDQELFDDYLFYVQARLNVLRGDSSSFSLWILIIVFAVAGGGYLIVNSASGWKFISKRKKDNKK